MQTRAHRRGSSTALDIFVEIRDPGDQESFGNAASPPAPTTGADTDRLEEG